MAHQEMVDPGQHYLVEGYSQSAAITIDENFSYLNPGSTRMSLSCCSAP